MALPLRIAARSLLRTMVLRSAGRYLSSFIKRADAHQKITELKRQPGKDILITGSRTLWNDLLAHDLIDEIHLMIGNVVLGEGIPVFVGKPPASLRLIDVRTWEHSDNVLLRYEVRRTGVENAITLLVH